MILFPGGVGHMCNIRKERKTRREEGLGRLEGHPWLHRKFRASLR